MNRLSALDMGLSVLGAGASAWLVAPGGLTAENWVVGFAGYWLAGAVIDMLRAVWRALT